MIDRTKPDITILCDICKCFLNVSELGTHTMYHNALQLYKFKVGVQFFVLAMYEFVCWILSMEM